MEIGRSCDGDTQTQRGTIIGLDDYWNATVTSWQTTTRGSVGTFLILSHKAKYSDFLERPCVELEAQRALVTEHRGAVGPIMILQTRSIEDCTQKIC